MTSHAALVARQMGRVCVVGCESLRIDYAQRCMTVKGDAKNRVVMEGDWLSIDGSTGEVLEGRLATKPSEVLQVLLEKSLAPEASPVYTLYATMMGWADKVRRLRVRANADQPTRRPTRSCSAPRGSASAAPSTCSSRETGSTRCAR